MSLLRISAANTRGYGSAFNLSNSGGIEFGLSAKTITARPTPVKFLEVGHFESAFSVKTASDAANVSLVRFHVPAGISATRLDFLNNYTVGGSTAGSFTMRMAIYTLSGSTASRASSMSQVITHNSGTNSTAASIYGAQSGTQWRSFALGTWNVTPGEYLLGMMLSQDGPAGTTGSHTFYGRSAISIVGAGNIGGATNDVSMFAGGIYSAGTSAPPASVHISDVNRAGAGLNAPGFRLIGTF